VKKYDLDVLQKYIDDGWLEVQSHPTLPLKVYNYSRECAWEKKWDEITTSARGLILDNDGCVIAKGFNKFLNYEEHKYEDIPWDDEFVLIQDKADGSLGILFNYGDEWHLATRGSFTSDQAIKGMEILKKNHSTYNDDLHPELTYLVEIVYPENRIVLDYFGAEKLILLGINGYGVEIEWDDVVKLNDDFFEVTNTTKVLNVKVDELKNQNLQNKEGYVLRFSPSNFRMKIKFEDYVRLHSLMTQFSNVDIWEALKDGKEIDITQVPDEFDKWVRDQIKEFKFNHYRIWDQIVKEFQYRVDGKYNDLERPSKKEFALWVNEKTPKWREEGRGLIPSMMFNLYDGKSIDQIIWKALRPKYSKPFWKKEVEI
jgi:RNA ligase